MSLLALAWLLLAPRAEACSCVHVGWPDEARCAAASRVFAGTVLSADWPLAMDVLPDELGPTRRLIDDPGVSVLLGVDTVWRGEADARMVTRTGFGGGDCGISAIPGTRFLVCDDRTGPVAWSFCAQPLLSDGPSDLEISLGEGHPPGPARAHHPFRWGRVVTLAGAWGAVGLGALLGLGLARFGFRISPKRRSKVFIAVLGLVVLVSLAARAWDETLELFPVGTWLPVLLALGVAPLAGLAGQLAPRGQRLVGLLAALVIASAPLAASRLSLHWPWPSEAAILCSVERARLLLQRREQDGHTETGRACTDFGLARFTFFSYWPMGEYAIFPAGDRRFLVRSYENQVLVTHLPDDYR